MGIVAILLVGVALFKSDQKTPSVAINQKANPAVSEETKLATTTPVIGDKEVDASVNKDIDNILNEDDIKSEINTDANIALSDESSLDQINNLYNDNEL